MLPSVTIMIPTYNQAHCIHQAIESAMAQDYPNLEIVIADDCSSDQTDKAVEPYLNDQRLRYFKNPTNIGRVKNYKKALEEYATGQWVVNCDGDDYYAHSDFISEVMHLIMKYKDENIVFAQGGHQVLFKNVQSKAIYELPKTPKQTHLYKPYEYFFEFHKIAHFSHLTTLYRRDIATSIDFYRYNISSTDMESFLRLSLYGSVLLIKKVYGIWVQHEHNFSQNLDFQKRKDNIKYITGSYHYALQHLNSKQLSEWKKTSLVNYFKDWLSKTAKFNKPFPQKVYELKNILKFAWSSHREVYSSLNLFKTLISLPLKLM